VGGSSYKPLETARMSGTSIPSSITQYRMYRLLQGHATLIAINAASRTRPNNNNNNNTYLVQ
jgi:hypothetical protein